MVCRKPNTGISESPCSLEASDDFEDKKLNLMWQWLGNPGDSFCSLTENPGFLRLNALNPSGKKEPVLWECSNVLTQKLVCPFFKASACLYVNGLKEKEQAGMVMMGGHYAYLAVRIMDGVKTLVYAEAYDAEDGSVKEKMTVLSHLSPEVEKVIFSFTMEEGEKGPVFKMFYTLEEAENAVLTDFMPSDHTWVGAKIGLFANALEETGVQKSDSEGHLVTGEKGGYADFEYIHVTSLAEGN